jgi:hypothetical protein
MATQDKATSSKIFTSMPDASLVTSGLTVVEFRRKKVATDQAYRACIVPSYSGNFAAVIMDGEEFTDADKPFTVALREAIETAASDLFRSYCEQNPTATEIPFSALTIEKIAELMAEKQSGARLNGEEIKAWYLQSETIKEAAVRYTDSEEGKKKAAKLQAAFISLASNNPGISIAAATKMMGYISEADTEHPICKAVGKRLEKLMTQDTADDL